MSEATMTDIEMVREALTSRFEVRAGMKPPPSISRAYAALSRIEEAIKAERETYAMRIDDYRKMKKQYQRVVEAAKRLDEVADTPHLKTFQTRKLALREALGTLDEH